MLGGGHPGTGKAIKVLLAKEILEERLDGTLYFPEDSTNIQQNEIEKYFGKSDICEVFGELAVGKARELEGQAGVRR